MSERDRECVCVGDTHKQPVIHAHPQRERERERKTSSNLSSKIREDHCM